MANIKLYGNTWDSSNIYDEVEGKTQAEVNSGLKTAITLEDDGYAPLFLTHNSYVKTDGSFATYNGWSRTDYIELPNTSVFFAIISETMQYCAFYDENKVFISRFQLTGSGIKRVNVPTGAKYAVLSASTETMSKLKVYGKGKWRDLYNMLLSDIVENTTASVTMNNGKPKKIEHMRNNTVIRTDDITYNASSIVEYRTDNYSRFYITITTDLDTLETEVK